jgi:hypothetical protein
MVLLLRLISALSDSSKLGAWLQSTAAMAAMAAAAAAVLEVSCQCWRLLVQVGIPGIRVCG